MAFLLVFVHHAPPLPLPGGQYFHEAGWIGVDLFFSLSALLFVKLLSKEYNKTGTISILKFYARRGLRIWPLYAVFCFMMVSLGQYCGITRFFSWRTIGLFTFTDNIAASFRGYNLFPYSDHLWTISFEEQFYVFIPLLLLFIFKSSRMRMVLTLSILAVIFFLTRAVMIWLKAPHPAIWVLPATHFESILLGMVVGLGGFDFLFSRIPKIGILAAGLLIGWLATQVGSIATINWTLMMVYALIGLSTSMILYCVVCAGTSRWILWLTFRPIVFLGKVSYGLYVYHLLGLGLGRMAVRHLGFPSKYPLWEPLGIFALSLLITIGIASMSYLLLEKPFLKYKKRFEIIASRPA